MHVLKDQDNVPDKVNIMLYKDYPDQFKEYFNDSYEQYHKEDKELEYLSRSIRIAMEDPSSCGESTSSSD